jgi:heme/copper-type cytochrome/quinol oxidase subunit 3
MSAHAAAASAGRSPERGIGVHDAKVGMWVFLASEVMFFTGLIGSYIILRFGASGAWAPPGEVLAINITALNTFILICSSVSMVKAFAAAEEDDLGGVRLWLAVTLLLGIVFLGIQAYEYRELIHHGFMPTCGEELAAAVPNCNLYGSTFYTMTGFHGFHVFLGVCCLAFTTVKAFRGRFNLPGVENMGLYWHFVDLVWIILFTIVYLI